MRNLLLLIFGLVALFDGFTTVLGTAAILGETTPGILISILFSLIILAFMIGTYPIWNASVIDTWVENKETEGCLLFFIRFLWIAAFLYDIFTSYSGNKFLVVGEETASASQEAILVGLTLLVSASPIFVSYMLNTIIRQREE